MSERGPIDFAGLKHVAVIMDGNGRWARRQGLVRTDGHRAGVDSVREVVTECARGHLEWLSLYALSTENFTGRPPQEVSVLMGLLQRFLIEERSTLIEHRVRLRAVGRIAELPAFVRAEIDETERLTKDFNGLSLALCLNYGGRAELQDAMRAIVREVRAGRLAEESLDEATVAAHLYEPRMPDVDLLIRTAGEMRISNFLLWQVSYAEIHTTNVCWPDFRYEHLEAAVSDFRSRKRRFGGLLEGEVR